jgi:hypothetical protein
MKYDKEKLEQLGEKHAVLLCLVIGCIITAVGIWYAYYVYPITHQM